MDNSNYSITKIKIIGLMYLRNLFSGGMAKW